MTTDKIILMTENCESIKIDGKYIENLQIDNIMESITKCYYNDNINTYKICKNFKLTLLADCNDYYCSNGNSFKSDFKLFDRLIKWKDIVSVHIFHNEDDIQKSVIMNVPYDGDEINKKMNCYINKDGNLQIIIE